MKIPSFLTMICSLTLLLLASCRTPKDIAYFQDLQHENSELKIASTGEIKVQPKDKLSIIVNTQDMRLTNLFNLPIANQQIGQNSGNGGGKSNGSAQGVQGYTVDSEGNIDFPVIGKIHVGGLTREEVASYIKQQLISRDLVKDPVVTVDLTNLGISIMGEVKTPGRYAIDRDNLTILEALSMAGDLTIYGKRENILVLRNENNTQKIYHINLCSAKDLYASPVYNLKQNDVVYVEPNETKVREATVNGNTVRSTSFWISLASLITSIAVLITK